MDQLSQSRQSDECTEPLFEPSNFFREFEERRNELHQEILKAVLDRIEVSLAYKVSLDSFRSCLSLRVFYPDEKLYKFLEKEFAKIDGRFKVDFYSGLRCVEISW